MALEEKKPKKGEAELPPEWVDSADRIRHSMAAIQQSIGQLERMHEQHRKRRTGRV